MEATFNPTPLFGGALTADLPSGYVDVSSIREVPDNQEVYLDMKGFSSIMFDLTERLTPEEAATDEDALKFHFNDAFISEGDTDITKFWHGNSAILGKMGNIPAYTLFATQHVADTTNLRRNTAEFTGILLILVRLEAQKTDIVISVNVPHVPGEYKKEDIDLESQKMGPLLEAGLKFRQRILESFEVKDWGLFVNEE